MHSFLIRLKDIDSTKISLAGGKGANLGELAQMEGIHVPDGFCVSTEAFKRITPSINELLERLSLVKLDEREKIVALSNEIRDSIESTKFPGDLEEEIGQMLKELGETNAYAIRSSATAEDLPTASFAGQQDTYLNIIGKNEIVKHISKCWASLFTGRAVTYRIQNGFDHRKVYLAVVVQKMVFPQAAGIMFTADPVSSHRKILSIDAGFGLGEALVSGIVNADNYKVRDAKIIDKKISTKKKAIYAKKNGGTEMQEIVAAQQNKQTLTDEQIIQLAKTGREIEAHFGHPQDIEWCLADNTFYIVQSRPITTLFPVPPAGDKENRVYISVGHQQMMTDAMKPLGLSFYVLTTRAPMRIAGGRLFVDVTQMLAAEDSRNILINNLGKFNPLITDALTTIMERGDFIETVAANKEKNALAHLAPPEHQEPDPATVTDFIHRGEILIKELKQGIQSKSGEELFDYILQDIEQFKSFIADPKNLQLIITPMNAAVWINEKIFEWLGETNVADTLALSVPGNITSEMGLELLDVADIIRPYPELIACLQRANDDDFLNDLTKLEGGKEARQAILHYLDKYGMRCAGEIDITRPRWSEKPSILVPLLLGNIRNLQPGAGKQKFERGREEAINKEQEILTRLKALPGGEEKAREIKRRTDIIRHFSGYREYPKYHMVNRYFLYKQALLHEAGKLAQAQVIKEKEDIFYLSFEEFRETVRTQQCDQQVIEKRKEDFRLFEKLTPPRVITSDGEVISGSYKRSDLPAGAIAGLPVSSGIVEGRARIILSMEDARLEEGDILVTTFTDPSWTPLFVSIKGLVTEVGGLMTHGAVIAREYGLPAVVGVENATQIIKDGQRIRVNGTAGYIEVQVEIAD